MRPLTLAAIFAMAFATTVAQAQETWVAVADDGGSNSGYAVGMTTREAARQIAWNDCNRRVPSHSCMIGAVRCFE